MQCFLQYLYMCYMGFNNMLKTSLHKLLNFETNLFFGIIACPNCSYLYLFNCILGFSLHEIKNVFTVLYRILKFMLLYNLSVNNSLNCPFLSSFIMYSFHLISSGWKPWRRMPIRILWLYHFLFASPS